MSHAALYRKYRPQKFSDVINQEHVKKTLINALALNKIAHAYLFSGPRGVGKTTIGRLLAKAVNCTNLNKKTGESCGKCDNCQEIASERSVDINEIDAASNRGIDEIRELREKIKYMPSKLKYRVFIIDEVHMLTIEAFNALLKTLEEPPKHIIFILATTEPQKIPATILSRCQRFDFKKINVTELSEHLAKIANTEKIKISQGAIKMIAINSDGSSRDALSLLGQVQSAFDKNKIEEKDIIDLLGLASGNLIIELAYLIFGHKIKESLNNVNDLIMRGYNPMLLLDSLIEFLRNLMLYKNTGNDEIFFIYQDQKTKIEEMISQTENKNIIAFINYLIESKNIQKYTSIVQLPLEMAIIKYIQPEEVKNVACNDENNSIKIKDNSLKNVNSKAVTEVNIKSKPADKIIDNTKIDFSAINSKWAEILENITETNYSLGLTMRSSRPLKVSGGDLIIECDYSFHRDCIQNSKNRDVIEGIINKKIGIPIGIKCVLGDKSKNLKTEDRSNINEKPAVPSHDLVNAALDIMGGEVVK